MSTDRAPHGRVSVEELTHQVEMGRVDTVVVAITDMQGRLQGKRCDAGYFLEHVRRDATEACNYLLAVDVDHEQDRPGSLCGCELFIRLIGR